MSGMQNKHFEFDARDVFRIVQFTDLHLITTETPQLKQRPVSTLTCSSVKMP